MSEKQVVTQPLLRVRDLRIGWGDAVAVGGIGFDVAPGEKVALVGESGSGKSVTAISLLGLLGGASVSGEALFLRSDGSTVDLLKSKEREMERIRGREIGMIFQEPMTALDPLFSIGSQIVEGIRLHEGLSKAAAWRKAVELLDRTGIQEPHERAKYYPHQLSGGQRQRAMIAMALACSPRLLLADEPTTALDVTLRVQIMELLSRLQREDGMAVLLISHDLGVVRSFANRMLVMEKGQLVEAGETQDVFINPQHEYTKKLLDSRLRRLVQEDGEDGKEGSGKPVVVEAQNVTVSYPKSGGEKRHGLAQLAFWRKTLFKAVDGVSISLHEGRTLGVIGESGSGKSTLAMAVLGLLQRQLVSGDIRIKGQLWGKTLKEERPLRAVIQVVFQDPFSSLSPRMTVGDIVAEGLLVHQPHLSKEERMMRVIAALEDVRLPADVVARYPHEFSGGQRQRIAIARALIVEPAILVLDEPTSALDVSIQMQVLELLAQLQKQKQLSYILITHDIGVVKALAHHVAVMRDGKVVETGSVDQIMNAPREGYTRALVNAAKELE
ncbi:MAG: ABC transporter ATP-binding protein [Saezia sp.]